MCDLGAVVERLDLHQGQCLAIRFTRAPSPADITNISDMLLKAIPPGVKVILLDQDIDMAIVEVVSGDIVTGEQL